MAGYNEYSKSNNAIAAENAGLMTASAVARLIGYGATAMGVKAVLDAVEWHHTSKIYNRTDYFDYDADLEEAAENSRNLRAEIIAASKLATGIRYIADVEYLEWSGKGRYMRITGYSFKDIEVEEKGDWYIFHFSNGNTKRKRQDSTGTYVSRKR